MTKPGTKDRVYEYIVAHADEAPSVREMCTALGISSTSTVFRAVHALEEEGKVRLRDGARRNVSLASDSYQVKVPVLSSFDPELPVLAQESIETFVDLNTESRDCGELFAVHMKGDSMKADGILDGDLVIAKRTEEAKEGDLVIVLEESRTAVKRFDPDTDRSVLLGKVIADYRYYQ